MKIQINTQKREENKIREVKIKSSLLVASFVFSMSLITLLLFFASSQSPREIDYQEDSEIKDVFKETGIYDFLDLDMCNDTKTSGEVSDFEGRLKN